MLKIEQNASDSSFQHSADEPQHPQQTTTPHSWPCILMSSRTYLLCVCSCCLNQLHKHESHSVRIPCSTTTVVLEGVNVNSRHVDYAKWSGNIMHTVHSANNMLIHFPNNKGWEESRCTGTRCTAIAALVLVYRHLETTLTLVHIIYGIAISSYTSEHAGCTHSHHLHHLRP